MTGMDFETATRESGASEGHASGWWRLYGPRLLVSVAVVAVLAGGAVYASRVSGRGPKVVYPASLGGGGGDTETSLKGGLNSAGVEELDELPEVGPAAGGS